MDKIVFTVKEISEALGIGINQAYDLVEQKDFPSMKINQKLLVRKDAFYEWMDANVRNKQ